MRQWAHNNKERIHQRYVNLHKNVRREYARLNSGEIKAKLAAKVTCECGIEVRLDGLAKHKRSKIHEQRMKGE